MKGQILIVDDESSIRLSLKKVLESEQFEVFCVANIKEALSLSPNLSFHVAFVDLNLPDGKGTDLIEKLQEKYPYIQSILITGERSVDLVSTISYGINKEVFHFLPNLLSQKPF